MREETAFFSQMIRKSDDVSELSQRKANDPKSSGQTVASGPSAPSGMVCEDVCDLDRVLW